MIYLGEHSILSYPQDWSETCKYGMSGKSGRSDSLEGAEDRVMFSPRSRRTYSYSMLARGLAQRMDISTELRIALSEKKCAVPIWCKLREDFSRTGLVFTFTGTVPAVGTNWLLYSSDQSSVLSVASILGQDVTMEVVADSGGGNGQHDGQLVPLLKGYIRPPKTRPIGGDCEQVFIDFIGADAFVPDPPNPALNWSFLIENATLDQAGEVDYSTLNGGYDLKAIALSNDGLQLVASAGTSSSTQKYNAFNLATAFDTESSPSVVDTFYAEGSDYNGQFHFSSDGYKFFILFYNNAAQYTLPVANDVRNKTLDYSKSLFESYPKLGFHVCANDASILYTRYTVGLKKAALSFAEDFGSVSDVSGTTSGPLGHITLSPDGTRLFSSISGGLEEYYLSTAFDHATATLFLSQAFTSLKSFYITRDSKYLYVLRTDNKIDRYILG